MEILQQSQSFYGCSASARSLTRARSFTGVRTRVAPKKEPREAPGSFLEARTRPKLSVSGVSPLRFSPRDKKNNKTKECDRREDILLEHQKPTTPTRHIATRSSPRLLKKSSLSCIGFSSVPSSAVQQKESNFLYAEHVSVSPDGGSAQCSMKTPKKEITEMDRCVVLLSPIRNPLKSPLHVSPIVLEHTCTLSCSHSDGTKSTCPLDSGLYANDEGIATSLDNVTSPAIRSSPRLLRKWKISENVNETLGECLFKPSETKITNVSAVISPNLQQGNSAGPKTPIRNHLNECVVCLTPIRRPLMSPVHITPRHINKSVSVDDTKVGVTSNLTNVEISPTLESLKTPCLSPRFSVSSSPPGKGEKRYRGLCSSPAETKRLSPLNQILRQQKQKRCLSGSPADKCLREDIVLDVRDTPAKEAKKQHSTSRDVSCHVVVQDNNSRTSEDVDDWLKEIQKEFDVSEADESQAALSPPLKKRRIHKSVVFGGKQAWKGEKSKEENTSCSLNIGPSFEEEDEVFHSSAVTASCLRQRRVNKTPLSASSIKVLQESPILCDGNLKVSPLLCTRNRSDLFLNSVNYCQKK